MSKTTLLAKSARHDCPAVSLLDHTRAVGTASRSVFSSIQQFLPEKINRQRLRELTLIGAVLHDLGKANNIFLGKLQGTVGRNINQPIRHEILSALIVAGYTKECRDFSKWLEQDVFKDCENATRLVWMLSWIVGGHHLKLHHCADHEMSSMIQIAGIPPEKIEFHGGDRVQPIITELVNVISDDLNITVQREPSIPDFSIKTDFSEDSHADLVENYIWESEEISEGLLPEERLLTAYAKGLVIAADVAGSALWSDNGEKEFAVHKAIEKSLGKDFSAANLDEVIDSRIDSSNKLYGFQKQAGTSTADRTVLEAACGGGKTIAAYEWAKQHEGRKLIFCYPTTGTASAGFEDYLLAQSELERTLVHSRADVDIARMNINGEGIPNEEANGVLGVLSLRAWGQQVIACTVDTVLGLIQNQRVGLFSFPAILKSAIVFDEIHSYDAKLFGALLRFLDSFPGIPVLLMTASLSPSRRKALEKWGGAPTFLKGNETEEKKKRYRIKQRKDETACWDDVSDALEKNKKVLWVCNTIRDAREVHKQAMEHDLPVKPILFHSRYRYKDRVDIQKNLLNVFNQKKPCLAITTQVCEMSLDISAGLLVSACAPFPSLIQRLGRLNRRGEESKGGLCLIYPFDGHDRRPYLRSDLNTADKIVEKLERSNFSQADLHDRLNNLPDDDNFKLHSAWLDDAWESGQATLREGANSITVIRKEDEASIREQCNSKYPTTREVMEWTIPMNGPMNGIPHDAIVGIMGGFPLIAEEYLGYDKIKGAEWKQKS